MKNIFFAFTSSTPANDILFDTLNNRVYLFETGELGRIICYDYDEYKIVAETSAEDFYVDHNIALGNYNGETEIYMALENNILIRDGNTLAMKDTIVISEFSGSRKVASLEFREPDILFIGPGNSSNSNEKGSMTYSRSNKTFLSNAELGDNQLRITTYIEDATPNIINVLGVTYQTSAPRIVLDRYDSEGIILENNINFSVQESVSHRLLKTSDNAPYFISSSEGNIFLKDEDLSFSQTIGGSHSDFVISDNGGKIYALTNDNSINILEYPSLNTLETIPLQAKPIRGFFDEQKLIIVYYTSTNNPQKGIYISKLDLI